MITKALKTSGMLDIVIDETGRVVDATIRQSLNSSFDTLIVRTARQLEVPAGDEGRGRRAVPQDARPGPVTAEDAMYERFYGFREAPFELTSNPRFLFFTAQHREALVQSRVRAVVRETDHGADWRSGNGQVDAAARRARVGACAATSRASFSTTRR